ncbi:nuclear receptor-interacting protein 1 [Salminus brasiliensis]|uniref:nuclear receptor-interacting protein 1 n=1 Tax=Salminus brasiliensis TaxID=930266 RepID=UPI003B83675D
MTHGEETGPETHQDSAVLTYLEGLLMHRVAGAQAATATDRGEAGNGNEEQRNKETTGLTLPRHSTQQEQDKTTPHGGTTQHLRKARLLRSEAWTEHESKRRSTPSVEVSGRMEEHHSGLNGSSQCKGESTLLASLLQSFNTRLQNVALSQQIVQSLMPQDPSSPASKPDLEDKAPGHGHGSGPSNFKGLMENSKVQRPSSSEPYHHRRPSQERSSESPMVLQHNTRPPSTESLPCTERLKAVANLVNIRSSPAPSPKPSVACSQLALLLSSEAHLQQYSREQALKAQLAGRSASERLAAMATHQTQAKKQPSTSGQPQINQDGLSSLHTKNGIPAQMSTSSNRQSPNLSTGQSRSEGSVRRTHPFRERRPFERHSRPSQNCSSLLLQLLNSHNTPQRLNCQGHLKEDVSVLSNRGSPLFSDSEHSNSGSSVQKDSSDAESTYSSCSPIDLSLKNKVNMPTPLSSSSSPALDKVTESLKNRWKSESPTATVPTEPKEVHTCPEMKPHHKVTLLELLLDHKNNEKANKALGNPELQPVTIPKVSNASTSSHSQSQFYSGRCKDTRELSPNCRLNTRSPKLLPTFSQGRDCTARASPYNLYSPSHTQSAPLDLCKTKTPASAASVKEAFSASKLLQNLAQCGKQNTAISPPPKTSLPPIKRQTRELKTASSAALLERLTAPVKNSNAPTWEGSHVKAPAVAESTQHGSEIENLLERRTVLQLLLGNKSQRERVGHKRKRESGKVTSTDKQTNHSMCHDNLSRPSTDISIKTEPVEDEMYDDSKVTKEHQSKLAESPRHSSHTLHQGSIKEEPLSPVDAARDGLLCHLLQQQHRTLKPVTLEDSNKGFIKEEPVEQYGPTIPKKRKFSVEPEDHAEVSQQGTCHSPGSQKANRDYSTSGIPETQKSSNPSSPPEADSPPAKFPPCESPSHENRGFNVLKQLLLSDNCLKELSQSRSTFSPLTHPTLNGSTIKEPHNNGELQSLRQRLSPSSVSTARAGTNRPESRPDVHATQQESSRSKPDITPASRDLRASVSLMNVDDKLQDCQLDSPRLTKANPILYYMLQRSNAHLVRESGELEARSHQCRVQMKVKEESEAFDFKLNPQIHNGTLSCDSPRLNGSLKKS